MKLAAQLFTIKPFLQTNEDIKKSFGKIKEIGYDAIQLSGMAPIDPMLVKEYIDEYKLEVCATHSAFDRIVNDTKALIADHKLWNCEYIGLGSMPVEYRTSKEGYDEFLKLIMPGAEKIYDSGLKFLYHNHHFEFARIDGKLNGMEYMAEKTDPKKFGFLADFYWVQAGGASPVAFIDKYADRIQVSHFKDMSMNGMEQLMTEIFEGNMDYKSIYEACLKNNVKWVAVEQDVCPADPFDSLKLSFDNIKSRGMF